MKPDDDPYENEPTVIGKKANRKPETFLHPGESFGQYKIISLLGRGGMGEVYAVEHLVLKKTYALKLIREEVSRDARALERFQREAGVMAQLEHPHIVRVDEFGQNDGRFWLRMELLTDGAKEESFTLRHYLGQKGPQLPEEQVLSLLRGLLGGLSLAHERKIAHLDLKPENILLKKEGDEIKAKITDFGLVRMVGEDWLQAQVKETVAQSLHPGRSPSETVGGGVTEVGEAASDKAIMGTYAYMSPEQRRGDNPDIRSDVYAVGLMGFQMLTGEETIGFDRPSELVQTLSRGWDHWVRKATRPKRQDRFENAQEMLEALPVGGKASERTSANPARKTPRIKKPRIKPVVPEKREPTALGKQASGLAEPTPAPPRKTIARKEIPKEVLVEDILQVNLNKEKESEPSSFVTDLFTVLHKLFNLTFIPILLFVMLVFVNSTQYRQTGESIAPLLLTHTYLPSLVVALVVAFILRKLNQP